MRDDARTLGDSGNFAGTLTANRNFVRLFAAQLTSLVGIGVTQLAQLASDPAAAHQRYHRWAAHAMLGGGILLSLALLPGILRPAFFTLLALWGLAIWRGMPAHHAPLHSLEWRSCYSLGCRW